MCSTCEAGRGRGWWNFGGRKIIDQRRTRKLKISGVRWGERVGVSGWWWGSGAKTFPSFSQKSHTSYRSLDVCAHTVCRHKDVINRKSNPTCIGINMLRTDGGCEGGKKPQSGSLWLVVKHFESPVWGVGARRVWRFIIRPDVPSVYLLLKL